jgi:hypothetical protein
VLSGVMISRGRMLEKLGPRSIHPSTWKVNFADFALTEF